MSQTSNCHAGLGIASSGISFCPANSTIPLESASWSPAARTSSIYGSTPVRTESFLGGRSFPSRRIFTRSFVRGCERGVVVCSLTRRARACAICRRRRRPHNHGRSGSRRDASPKATGLAAACNAPLARAWLRWWRIAPSPSGSAPFRRRPGSARHIPDRVRSPLRQES